MEACVQVIQRTDKVTVTGDGKLGLLVAQAMLENPAVYDDSLCARKSEDRQSDSRGAERSSAVDARR